MEESYCFKQKNLSFPIQQQRQRSDVTKSKMAARGKFKSHYLEQLSINSRQQPRFPLNYF